MDQFLERDIQYLKGVGDKRARLFHKLGIFVVGDLVRYYPRTYEDWSVTTPAAQAPEGTTVCVQATMVTPMRTHLIRKGMTLYKADFTDGETLIHVTLFNTKFLAEKLRMYQDYLLLGKVERNFTTVQMSAPKIEPLTARRIHPIYTQTGSLNANLIAKAVDYALAHMAPLPDTLSPALREKYGLEDLDTAVRNIHFPSNAKALGAARHRLIFEELLTLTVGLKKLKGRKRTPTTRVIEKDCTAAFAARLPFTLTGAQSRAVAQCIADLQSGYPMNRLLQGDVGSGKTAVAAALLDTMVQNGYQCALMAPTEILATQHYATLQKFFAGTNPRLCLLTGACTAKEKRQIKADLLEGNIHIAVGTHALIQNDVEFANLGLVITDEQHRFGVRQRGALAEKAANPHLLVMSATPIPRTLGLLIYGDLDISILDELPPGRKPVKTRCITGKKRQDLYGFLDREIDAGRQVYIVCPAIEDTPDGGLNAVKTYYEDIAKALLPERRVGLMHGKLKPKEKAAVMEDFKAGRLDALVSTTVIEVGVDVPNATVMVIENAERYGLSALHQLRGRVGRGAAESWCFLVSDNTGENVQKRLKFLCSTADGFAVAQYDLETRGPGDFFGSRQHGLPTLQIADLMNDTRTLHAAQSEAAAMLAEDPLLEAPEHALLEQQVQQMFEKAGAMN